MSVFFTPWWRNKKVKRQTLGEKCWIFWGNFFLVLVSFIRRSLVEHQTNLGYALYSILPPAVLTCLGGMSRNRKGFPWRQWASDFRVPALMSFFSFWGKSRGTLRPRIYPEGLSQVELDSLLELQELCYEILSPDDPSGEWSQSWFAALDNQKQPT